MGEIPELRDWLFTASGGRVMANGKSQYPDLLRLELDGVQAASLLADLANALRNGGTTVNLSLMGKLERFDDE